jgi:hypothetical protein
MMREHASTIADLRWLFLESEGELGVRSNFEPMRARLECGGRTGGRPILEIDERSLDAAEKARYLRRAFEAMRVGCACPLAVACPRDSRECRLLRAAFGGEEMAGPRAQVVYGALGPAAGVAPETATAIRAHAAYLAALCDAGAHRLSPREWLSRLCLRAAQGGACVGDAVLVRAIRREADALLVEVLRRFSGARRRVRR